MRLEGDCIIIENRPVPLAVRIFTFTISFPLFCIGLLALYNTIIQLLTDAQQHVTIGGFIIGTLITAFFLTIPALIILYVVLEPYKTLRLDPRTRQGYLTRRYPCLTQARYFEFHSIALPSVSFREEAGDTPAGWLLTLKLPDRTTLHYEAVTLPLVAQKAFAEEWSERISTMLQSAS